MLGRDESVTRSAAIDEPTVGAITKMTTTTTTVQPVPPTVTVTTVTPNPRMMMPVTAALSWPSSDWIMKAVERIRAETRDKGIQAGGATGPDPYDYDDGGDDDDDDDDDIGGGGDEIEEIPIEPIAAAEPQTTPPPPPTPPRAAVGHMSRYQFRRIDGRPDDGRVNGTYVAVVESDRPPLGVVYNPVSKPLPR